MLQGQGHALVLFLEVQEGLWKGSQPKTSRSYISVSLKDFPVLDEGLKVFNRKEAAFTECLLCAFSLFLLFTVIHLVAPSLCGSMQDLQLWHVRS